MSATELAALALPGLPAGRGAIARKAKRERWPHETRHGQGGGTRVYPVSCLPDEAQRALATGDIEPDKTRARIVERIRVVERALELGREMPQGRADELAAGDSHFSPRVVRLWRSRVQALPREAWPELLTPGYRATAQSAEVHPDAWAYIKSDYLRGSRPAFAACYRRLVAVAESKGWSPVPPEVTLRRKFAREVPNTVCVAAREGVTALERLVFPSQERDRSALMPLEGVNSDGHMFDVPVLWPDGSVERPIMLAWQDLATNFILSWRLARTENADLVRVSFGDMVDRWGVPDCALLDNGRAYAAYGTTGGQKTRFRFKVHSEQPDGVLTALGVRVHWATPHHGQSKPIERAWRDLCEDISRHPAFEGAYLGSNPTKRPHDYDKRKVIPLADFLKVCASMVELHNTRTGRRGQGMHGRSFAEVFREGYERRTVRKLTAAQRHLLLLATKALTVRAGTSEVHLAGNRYAHPDLANVRGKVFARLDPDDLHAGLYLYTVSGQYIGHAACVDKQGFFSAYAAREHARAKRQVVKAVKNLKRAHAALDARQLSTAHLEAIGAERIDPAAVALVPGLPARHESPIRVTRTEADRQRDEEDSSHVLELGRGALEVLRRRAG